MQVMKGRIHYGLRILFLHEFRYLNIMINWIAKGLLIIMKKIKIMFGQGDELIAVLNEKEAPTTASLVWDSLPYESEVTQSRWSGREVNFKAKLHSLPPRENQTIYTSIGEVCYWRDWRLEEGGKPGHVIAIYYGAETTRSHMGEEPVNVFGQVENTQFEEMKKIGERIWLGGLEKIRIERVH